MLVDQFERIHEKKKESLLLISHQERIIRMADRILVVGERFRPSRRISPLSALSIPIKSLAMVDLPPPLGPVITSISPSFTEKLTTSTVNNLKASNPAVQNFL